MEIKNICVHHSGGLGSDYYAETAWLTFDHVNNAHQGRWPNFPSRIKGPKGQANYVGYNFWIFPDGKLVQCRPLGAETAAQKGNNFDTISIHLSGNFTKKPNGLPVETPTPAQLVTLKKVMLDLINNRTAEYIIEPGTTFNFSTTRIYPHRVLQPNHTECYGNVLPDDWARKLVTETTDSKVEVVKKIQELWRQVNDIILKINQLMKENNLGERDRSCSGNI